MKIGIFGDSWSYCAWKNQFDSNTPTETKTDTTFQQLLPLFGVEANNYSQPGSSNQEIADTVKFHANDNLDAVVVFQTDPLRDIRHKWQYKLLPYDQSAGSLNQMCVNLCDNFYQQLFEIQQKIQKPVIMIGGLSVLCYERLPASFLSLPQSWTEIVVPEFSDCYYEFVELPLLVFETFREKYNWGSLADFEKTEQLI